MIKPELNIGTTEHSSLRTLAVAAGAAVLTALIVKHGDTFLDGVSFAIEASADLNPNSH